LAALARSITWAIIGLPASSANGFPGKRVDSYLAGIPTAIFN